MDKEEIKSLINRWAFYADARKAEAQVALFADIFENSTIMPDGSKQTFTDKAELCAGIKSALGAFQKTFHMNGQTEITENHATSYCIAHHFRADGTVLVMYIRYEDDFVLENNEVKFSQRVLHIEQVEER
ncbi:nuclear transport factor 2 family protein [Lactococcus nasutitermitis]|uniref:Nuclear transport factor 2 family protein n=1 Tax=Lactococcus nasutitermitis TaxID=1652957 RepID=A0ABV9JDZ8_9LACT|nr:nuclear transport factor 2 family protein [Lactococcus nasutitermitis]